jgi:hypothetical protein
MHRQFSKPRLSPVNHEAMYQLIDSTIESFFEVYCINNIDWILSNNERAFPLLRELNHLKLADLDCRLIDLYGKDSEDNFEVKAVFYVLHRCLTETLVQEDILHDSMTKACPQLTSRKLQSLIAPQLYELMMKHLDQMSITEQPESPVKSSTWSV